MKYYDNPSEILPYSNKTMKMVLLIISLFLCGITLSAQDVEGVDVCTKMAKNQVIQKFGQPEEYVFKDSYMDEEAKYELYYYGNGDTLVFVNEYLYDFYVKTQRWSVLLTMIEGGVKIGDPFSKMASLNPKVAEWINDSTYYIPCGDFPLLIRVRDGLITFVSFETK